MYSDPSGYAKTSTGNGCDPKVQGENAGDKGDKKKEPYSYLENGPTVGEGKAFTAAQKQKMLKENMKRNGINRRRII